MVWFTAEKPRAANEGASECAGRAFMPSAFLRPIVMDGPFSVRERALVVDA